MAADDRSGLGCSSQSSTKQLTSGANGSSEATLNTDYNGLNNKLFCRCFGLIFSSRHSCVNLTFCIVDTSRNWQLMLQTVVHWRRQLWGTGARAPPRLPASYFGDHSLYRLWRKCTKQRDFCAIFYQFLAHFCHFFAHSFPQGVIIVPKMPDRSPINFNSTRTSDSGKTGS